MDAALKVGDSVRFAYYDMRGVRLVVGVVTSLRRGDGLHDAG